MVSGESPKLLFDFVMTRCEENYNPTFIFDAACKSMEVALNREPRRFSAIRIVSDPLHAFNHVSCAHSFNSSYHSDLTRLNKEACEQFNSVIRNIQSSVSYMNYANFLNSIKIFIMRYNRSTVINCQLL